jgi:hypothetical protein
MNSLEEIGALLGFVAFAGLAVLVFLTFQQARHIRRLRDWAGRAPERAAAQAARDAGEDVPEDEEDGAVAEQPAAADEAAAPAVSTPDRAPATSEPAYELAGGESRWDHFREEVRVRWIEWDRRSPVDLKLLLGGILAVVLGLGIATGGFGLFGGDDGGTGSQTKAAKQAKNSGGSDSKDTTTEEEDGVEVAVLNGTAPAGGTGVPGVADKVSGDVEGAGFTVGEVDDAGSFTASVVMYSGDGQADAEDLAAAMEALLGPTEVVEMTPEVEALAGGASVALIVGQDDSTV